MTTHKLRTILLLMAPFVATVSVHSQIVRIEFTGRVNEVTGSPLVGVTVGSIITGRVEVDLAQLPADEDPWDSVGSYYYGSLEGGHPGFIMEFSTGLASVRFDSVNAANDPGLTPGIFVDDEAGSRDLLSFQQRDQGKPFGANLSFEAFTIPRTLMSGDYFPESVNFAGVERAWLNYSDYFGGNALVATVTSASMTIEPGGSIASILAMRLEASDLPAQRKRLLLAILQDSQTAFNEGQCEEGLRKLRSFQNIIRAQVEKSDPALADRLLSGVQAIINAGCVEVN